MNDRVDEPESQTFDTVQVGSSSINNETLQPSSPCKSQDLSSGYKSIGVNTQGNIHEVINNLHNENKKLQERLAGLEAKQMAVRKLFTERQIKRLENPNLRPIWTVEELSRAITIYSTGPRAYCLLLKNGYPFPTVPTLRAWTKRRLSYLLQKKRMCRSMIN